MLDIRIGDRVGFIHKRFISPPHFDLAIVVDREVDRVCVECEDSRVWVALGDVLPPF